MNPLHDLNQALAYLEDHLDDDLDLAEAARRAGFSPYHFSRMFTTLAGVTLTEYVRRRRMTLAAGDLRVPGVRIIDLAVKYGYSSADAFSRAFCAVHGVMPSQSREAPLKAFPRMSFQLTIQGAIEMKYRLLSQRALRVVGLCRRVRLIYEGINPEIQAMFQSLDAETIATLKSLSNLEPAGIIQATTNFSEDREEGSSVDHYIGAATTEVAPERLATLEVAASEWAVFECRGPFPQTMQAIWARIYTEWFPSSGYQHAGGPEMVWSSHRDVTEPEFHNEIWIPVARI